MRSIGIYLGASPNGGGTYQYNLSILEALRSFPVEEFRITAFYESQEWARHLPNDFVQVFASRRFATKVAGRIVRVLGGRRGQALFNRHFASIVREINQSSCDLVIFPSQDSYSYLADKRGLVAIHDLMHRYARSFEEYAGEEFDARENHYGQICAAASGILVDSKMGKSHVIESYSVEASKIFVLPFVPPGYILKPSPGDVRKKFGLPERFLLYPAQFWEHKNHIRLIEAIGILRKQGMDVPLVLVGSKKNNFHRAIKTIATEGVSDLVKVLGYVANEDMRSLYESATAMIFVSLIGPTNIPPLEAMAVGCPLICSDAYAMPEQTGDAALLVNALDSADIAEKIHRLWLDDGLRKELVQRGFARATVWNQDAFNRRLLEIVRALL